MKRFSVTYPPRTADDYAACAKRLKTRPEDVAAHFIEDEDLEDKIAAMKRRVAEQHAQLAMLRGEDNEAPPENVETALTRKRLLRELRLEEKLQRQEREHKRQLEDMQRKLDEATEKLRQQDLELEKTRDENRSLQATMQGLGENAQLGERLEPLLRHGSPETLSAMLLEARDLANRERLMRGVISHDEIAVLRGNMQLDKRTKAAWDCYGGEPGMKRLTQVLQESGLLEAITLADQEARPWPEFHEWLLATVRRGKAVGGLWERYGGMDGLEAAMASGSQMLSSATEAPGAVLPPRPDMTAATAGRQLLPLVEEAPGAVAPSHTDMAALVEFTQEYGALPEAAAALDTVRALLERAVAHSTAEIETGTAWTIADAHYLKIRTAGPVTEQPLVLYQDKLFARDARLRASVKEVSQHVKDLAKGANEDRAKLAAERENSEKVQLQRDWWIKKCEMLVEKLEAGSQN